VYCILVLIAALRVRVGGAVRRRPRGAAAHDGVTARASGPQCDWLGGMSRTRPRGSRADARRAALEGDRGGVVLADRVAAIAPSEVRRRRTGLAIHWLRDTPRDTRRSVKYGPIVQPPHENWL